MRRLGRVGASASGQRRRAASGAAFVVVVWRGAGPWPPTARRPRRVAGVDVEAAKRPSRTYGILRAVSGVLAVGLVLLALGNIGVQFYANSRDLPGPDTLAVTAHVVAAMFAVAGQIVADRYADWRAPVASLVVLAVAGATLWTFWWA